MKFKRSNLEPVVITLNGETYLAKLNFKALAEVEDLSGRSFLAIFNDFANEKISIKDVIHILYAGMKNGGVEVELSDLYDADFTDQSMPELLDALTQMISRSQVVDSQLEESKKKAQA